MTSMPLYYFDVRDAQGVHRDTIGVYLASMEAAIAEGRRALVEMSRDNLVEDSGNTDLEIMIRDHGEGPVRLVLSMKTEGPADGGA